MPYFLDEMQMWEANELVTMVEYSDRNSWEQTRSIMYLDALEHSGKGNKPKPNDILKFAWDKKVSEGDTTITQKQVDRLRQRAEEIRNKYILNNG